MLKFHLQNIAVGVVVAGALTLGLAACTAAPDAAPSTSDAAPGSSGADSPASDLVVVPGTGSYAIGEEVPFGGYQLSGEPAEQPAGCTWAILDADGVAIFENQGSYAFLTDIPEAVTFETSGCPDWEQSE